MPDGLEKERKRSPRVVIVAVVVVAILIAGAVAWLAVQIANNRSEYTKHSTISITGNAGFTKANGVVRGSGTASDPYIIANWDINASNAASKTTMFGISIKDTNVHFIVKNCYVHSYLSRRNGISLYDCVNGTLDNNTCTNIGFGIVLSSSSKNTLSNNNCSSNGGTGISLISSSNSNTLNNNTCSFGGNGIYLYSSSNNNMLRSNNCNANYWAGIDLSSSGNNTLDSNRCSSNVYCGISLDLASNSNEIYGNQVSNNSGCGISVSSGSNNEISFNEFSNNIGCGVNISSGSDNDVFDNAFIGNNGATGTYIASHAQASDDGTNNSWNYTYVYSWDEPGNYWSDWTTPDVVPPQNIVDYPYIIAGNAGAKDYYPLPYNPRYIGIMALVNLEILS